MMMIWPLALLLTMSGSGPGHDTAGFADGLMRQRDYFRAITEYKRALYEDPEPRERSRCMLQIARAYRRSAHFEPAVQYAGAVLQSSSASAADQQDANVELGLTYLAWQRAQLAVPFLDSAEPADSSGFSTAALGLADLAMHHPAKARERFSRAAALADSARRADLTWAADAIASDEAIRGPSPATATLLSLVLPGAGQAYSGHVYDGVQALGFVATFALATVAYYRYEHDVTHHLGWTFVSASVTGMFHAANLVGAHRTAQYRNWKRREDLRQAVAERVLRGEP